MKSAKVYGKNGLCHNFRWNRFHIVQTLAPALAKSRGLLEGEVRRIHDFFVPTCSKIAF